MINRRGEENTLPGATFTFINCQPLPACLSLSLSFLRSSRALGRSCAPPRSTSLYPTREFIPRGRKIALVWPFDRWCANDSSSPKLVYSNRRARVSLAASPRSAEIGRQPRLRRAHGRMETYTRPRLMTKKEDEKKKMAHSLHASWADVSIRLSVCYLESYPHQTFVLYTIWLSA